MPQIVMPGMFVGTNLMALMTTAQQFVEEAFEAINSVRPSY